MNAVARYLLPQDVCLDLDVASKRQLFHAIGQRFDSVASAKRVDRVGDPALVRDDLLSPERNAHRFFGSTRCRRTMSY